MVRDMAYVLLRHRDIPDLHKLDVYRQHGGYEGLKKALSMTRVEVCLLYTSDAADE